MKRIKTFLVGLFLTQEERDLILNSLWYSTHTYTRRGNVDAAVVMQNVLDKVQNIMGEKAEFDTEEVDKLVEKHISNMLVDENSIIKNIAVEQFEKAKSLLLAEQSSRIFSDEEISKLFAQDDGVAYEKYEECTGESWK